MDMAYMGAGKVPRDYEMQLNELAFLQAKYPNNIRVFVHIDCRRPGYYDLFRKSIEYFGFDGVKMYNSLGVFPYDERYNSVYEYCVKYGLPIIAHCTPSNPVHFKGNWKELYLLLKKSKTPIDFKGKSKKELCNCFSHPLNWEYVCKDFPELKVSLAHFGGSEHWSNYLYHPERDDNWYVHIKEMLPKYDNLYTDVSFTMYKDKYFPLLKVMLADEVLKNKILWGTDYYMNETECNERQFSINLRAYLGEELFKLIAEDNPKRFMG